jgi:hypothetical protein
MNALLCLAGAAPAKNELNACHETPVCNTGFPCPAVAQKAKGEAGSFSIDASTSENGFFQLQIVFVRWHPDTSGLGRGGG